MKPILLSMGLFVALLACSSSPQGEAEETPVSGGEIVLKNGCDFITAEDVTAMFAISQEGMETYAKTPSSSESTCQYIWQGTASPMSGNQLMITIQVNDQKAEMPRRFSNMLRVNLETGLLGVKQEKIIPTPMEGLGEYAYHWEQLSYQNTQKICFQKNEDYYVEVMHNANETMDTDAIKTKLIEIAKTLYSKL